MDRWQANQVKHQSKEAYFKYKVSIDTGDNATIQAFQKTGSTAITVGLPYVYSGGGNGTNGTLPQRNLDTVWQRLRLLDYYVVFYPPSATPTTEGVHFDITHSGISQVVDDSFRVWNFTHQSMINTEYFYNGSSRCPVQQACAPNTPFCPEAFNFSPFGVWNISDFSNPGEINRTEVTGIEIVFHLEYDLPSGKTNGRLFDANTSFTQQGPFQKECN